MHVQSNLINWRECILYFDLMGKNRRTIHCQCKCTVLSKTHLNNLLYILMHTFWNRLKCLRILFAMYFFQERLQ